MSTKKITTVGMLCAMAMIVNVLISFPIVPAVSFLRYDPKDILIVIGGSPRRFFATILPSGEIRKFAGMELTA